MSSDTIQETESLQRICMPLLAWYEENARDLEWRRNPLPYYVWVSEIMLQQTRVETVKPYFARFIRELPDIRHLALCSEDRLMKLWEGLGYYSRARNLQKAAQTVLDRYQGELPADADALRSLPGIGSYTSGAIASIAFALPQPAVDGNVLRVLTRITASTDCIDEPKVKTMFESRIRALLEGAGFHPGAFNQALMELGAMVCLPNGAPLCEDCPVKEMCLARSRNLTSVIPVRKKKSGRRIEKKTILVIRDLNRALIRKRPERGLLAGLWELPNYEGHLSRKQALEEAEKLGISAIRISPLPPARHVFTHIEWEMEGYLILAEEMDQSAFAPADGKGRACRGEAAREQNPSACSAVGIGMIREAYPIPSAFSGYTLWLDPDRSWPCAKTDSGSGTIG